MKEAPAMVVWVTEAKALPGYRLWLRFSDAACGEVNLRDFVDRDHRSVVRQLRDPVAFADIRVEADTVVWGNGFDLAPEFLRARLESNAAA